MKSIKLDELSWPEIGAAIENGFTTVVFALGSTEQHGPALPEHTDTIQGDYIAGLVARKIGDALQAPTMHLGCSDHHLSFPGTISLGKSTLKAVIQDMVSSLARHGFTNIVILPFHGGNYAPLADILPQLRTDNPKVNIVAFTDLGKAAAHIVEAGAKKGYAAAELGAHADAWESSNMLFLRPESVQQNAFAEGYTGSIGEAERQAVFENGMAALSENGILGDSRRSDEAHGEFFLEDFADFLYQELKDQLKA